MKMILAVSLVALLVGCGGQEPAHNNSLVSNAAMADQLESDMPKRVTNGTLSKVQCIHREGRQYECLGTFRLSRTTVLNQLEPGSDQQLVDDAIQEGSGPIVYDVLVDEDGSYIMTIKP